MRSDRRENPHSNNHSVSLTPRKHQLTG
uniref:Uncharacterized protein n=1 Tax=Anguilla anguilla TaxID=7936 RepID=A0A0E9URG7_ANGAN